MTFRTTLAVAVGLTVAVTLTTGLSACAPTPEEVMEPTPTFSDEAEAFAAAEATYREYVKALNAVDLSDPKTFEDVYAWTTGDLNASDREGLAGYHADGATVSGDSTVMLATGLTYSDHVVLAVCLDVSAVRVVDAEGRSLVERDRAEVQRLAVSLSRKASSSTGLLIDGIGPRSEGPTCTP